jgi:preprotein translocase subunit SecG
MYAILLVIHVIIAVMLIGLILIQHGKGAQTGAAFGSGASQTVFGSQGSGGFLSQTTGILAALFFAVNLLIVFLLNRANHQEVMANPAVVEKAVQEKGKTTEPAGKTDVPEVD